MTGLRCLAARQKHLVFELQGAFIGLRDYERKALDIASTPRWSNMGRMLWQAAVKSLVEILSSASRSRKAFVRLASTLSDELILLLLR